MCKQSIDNVIVAAELLAEALQDAQRDTLITATGTGSAYAYDASVDLSAARHNLKTVSMFLVQAKRKASNL